MKNEKAKSNQNGDLRHQAEERLMGSGSDPAGFEGEGKDARALVHELQVHQIELEMQNEELKLAKLETENALMKYSDLYDFAPIGLFAFDAQGLIQEVNLAGAKLLGMERRNLMNGRHFQRFVAPKDCPFFDDFCKKAFETSIKQTCELNLLKDGKPTVYARIEGIVAEDGSTNGRQCRIAAIDITERKKAERILGRYQLISKYARDIILLMGRDGCITEANEAAINAYGYSRDELLSKNICDLRDPETLEKVSNQMQLADSEGLLFETKHIRKDGSTFPVEVSSLGTVIEGERVLLSIIRDITEREQAKKALQKSEQRYATTLASIGDAIISTDIEGKITFMNKIAEELTGWTLHEASMKPAKDVFNIINEHTRRKVEDPVTKVLDKGVIVGLANHTILVRRDGTEIPIDDSGAPINDRDGKTTGVVLVFRDISERRKAMREIESLAKFADENPNPVLRIAADGTIIYANRGSILLLEQWGCQIGQKLPGGYGNLISFIIFIEFAFVRIAILENSTIAQTKNNTSLFFIILIPPHS